jgi:hypothetical protein
VSLLLSIEVERSSRWALRRRGSTRSICGRSQFKRVWTLRS